MDDAQAQLLREQLGRFTDNINSRFDALEERLRHHTDLDIEKTASIKSALADLTADVKDHETRLRSVTDGVTTFRTWSGLASGGSSIMAIVAFVKSFIG